MAYSEQQVNELKAIEGLNYEKAEAFGEKHGFSVRSVIAKARALDLDYTKKEGGKTASKKKASVRRKSDVATAIVELLDMGNLASLDKMTLADLEVLEAALKEFVGA